MPSQAGSATKICSRFHNVRSTTLAKSPRCRLPDSLVMPNANADCKGHSLRVPCRQVAHKNSFDARRFKLRLHYQRLCHWRGHDASALGHWRRSKFVWASIEPVARLNRRTAPTLRPHQNIAGRFGSGDFPNGTPDLDDGFATTRDGSLGKGRNRSEGNGFDHANDFADVPCLGSAEPGAQSHHAAIDGVRRYR